MKSKIKRTIGIISIILNLIWMSHIIINFKIDDIVMMICIGYNLTIIIVWYIIFLAWCFDKNDRVKRNKHGFYD